MEVKENSDKTDGKTKEVIDNKVNFRDIRQGIYFVLAMCFMGGCVFVRGCQEIKKQRKEQTKTTPVNVKIIQNTKNTPEK